MNYTDVKYLNLISSQLRNFKKKTNSLWNFSCPLCGDSEKNKLKARGYIYEKMGSTFYRCHNCGAGISFSNFLKEVDEARYREHLREKFINKNATFSVFEEQEIKLEPTKNPPVIILPSIEQLDKIHKRKNTKSEAVEYIRNRKIPDEFWGELYWTADFKRWSNTVLNTLFENTDKDFEAIVIPFINKNQELIGYQGRAFKSKGSFRYSTVRLKQDVDMIYGMHNVNLDEHIYIVEGPFDSMFLPNAIALRSSSVKIPDEILEKNNFTIVFDNEPRNYEIVQQLISYAKKGYNICVWNDKMSKDVNQSVLDGHSKKEIAQYITQHTFYGLNAIHELNRWKKVRGKYNARNENERRATPGIY